MDPMGKGNPSKLPYPKDHWTLQWKGLNLFFTGVFWSSNWRNFRGVEILSNAMTSGFAMDVNLNLFILLLYTLEVVVATVVDFQTWMILAKSLV